MLVYHGRSVFAVVTICRYLLRCHGLSLSTVASVGRVGVGGSLCRVAAGMCAVGTGSRVEAGKRASLTSVAGLPKSEGLPLPLHPSALYFARLG